jgi:signal transduction histidine kinase
MTLAGADAPLLRRTRWRLMAWSGGLTLLVLLLLGAAIYLAVGRVLEAQAVTQLQRRAQDMARLVAVGVPQVAIPIGPTTLPGSLQAGVAFLGPTSGTFAMIVGPNDEPVGLGRLTEALGLPYREGLEAARNGEMAVDSTQLLGNSVRVLSLAAKAPDGSEYVIQVVSDKVLEDQALAAILRVLGFGGVLVMAAALGFGYLYAGRALVPIRESLRRQREFAADVSHELRTPLSVVRATVAELERRPHDRIASARDDLREIEAQSERLTELIDELLLFARAESGAVELAMEPLDLSEAAVAATHRLERLAEQHGVRIEAQLTPVPMRGDARRLEQLTSVLVDNAIRHSPPGKVVEVRVSTSHGNAHIEVEDRGPGIAPDELERIFDRFNRSAASRPGGVGLGLAIARWITERHGGSIRAENRDRGGARFVVDLPIPAPG